MTNRDDNWVDFLGQNGFNSVAPTEPGIEHDLETEGIKGSEPKKIFSSYSKSSRKRYINETLVAQTPFVNRRVTRSKVKELQIGINVLSFKII